MEFQPLMDGLMEVLGFKGGRPADEQGIVRIGMDETSIAFVEIPETRELLVWSRIGSMPQSGADRLREAMLRANFMGRAVSRGTLSQSDDGGVFLQRFLSLPQMDVGGLMSELEGFVAAAVEWSGIISRCEAGAPPEASGDAESPSGKMIVRG